MSTVGSRKPWDQMDDETPKAYAAFVVFRDLGPSRTLVETTRRFYRSGKGRDQDGKRTATRDEAVGCIRDWARTHKWVARARLYDDHLHVIRDRAIVKATESEAEQTARLRERSNQETLAFASSLKLRAAEMLNRPLDSVCRESSRTSEDGYTTNIFQTLEPAKWMQRDIVTYVRAARELEEVVLFPERRGSAQARGPVDPPTSDAERNGDPPASDEELARAATKLQAWRAEQMVGIIAFPDRPPGSDAETWQGGSWNLLASDGNRPSDPPRFFPVDPPPPIDDEPEEKGRGPRPPRHLGFGRTPQNGEF